ncbi:MAG: four helix bundle protein [Bacteroidales bacterium]|nr:four helix bundle protein [Bacteroidales bacterium]
MYEPEEKQVSFFRFDDLRIYHKTLDYIVFLFNETQNCPQELRTKFIDAADAVAQAIAEGSTRSKQHCATILKGAKPNVRACVVYTAIAMRLGVFDEATAEESNKHLMEITKMLGAFIGSLTKVKPMYNNSSAYNSETEMDEMDLDVETTETPIENLL